MKESNLDIFIYFFKILGIYLLGTFLVSLILCGFVFGIVSFGYILIKNGGDVTRLISLINLIAWIFRIAISCLIFSLLLYVIKLFRESQERNFIKRRLEYIETMRNIIREELSRKVKK